MANTIWSNSTCPRNSKYYNYAQGCGLCYWCFKWAWATLTTAVTQLFTESMILWLQMSSMLNTTRFVWKNDEKVMLNGKVYADIIHREAEAFVRKHAENKQPFFMYLAEIIPHADLDVPADSMAQYDGKIKEEKLSKVIGSITHRKNPYSFCCYGNTHG